MAQMTNTNSSARAASLARRRAMSTSGKSAISNAVVNNTVADAAVKVDTSASAMAYSRATTSAGSAASAARLRRQALATRGKAADNRRDRTRTSAAARPEAEALAGGAISATATQDGTSAGGCGCGCNGKDKSCSAAAETTSSEQSKSRPIRTNVRRKASGNSSRAVSLARRHALSSRGKAAISSKGMTAAQTARAANPNLSGRELAQMLREQRSQKGSSGEKKSEAGRRVRPAKNKTVGAAQDATWKVGASETSQGQTLTGTMTGRSEKVTGDEASTCRNVTGTEYMGADIFRNFCQSEPAKKAAKVGISPTSRGNKVSGNEIGRSNRVTGDEPGTCKLVTGTEYIGADQAIAFCGNKINPAPSKISLAETRHGKLVTGNNVGRSGKVTGDEPGSGRELTGTQYMQRAEGKSPAKVGVSSTLRGGNVTGSELGRSEKVTGDEPGSCKNVTGDEYISKQQYSKFCDTTPLPQDSKTGLSQTLAGKSVSGTMTGRSERVTGDEPGTCKAITGTPYAGAEQYKSYCKSDDARMVAARSRTVRGTPGAIMTGLQPGLGGNMTGDQRGACKDVSGTPYVGADQFAAACPATAAQPGNADFPQALTQMPWGQFSTTAPLHAAQTEAEHSSVTGTRYEQGKITGPFGMAGGTVTGTEEFRFGRGKTTDNLLPAAVPAAPISDDTADARSRSRVTGEGMNGAMKITGDDWDRGDRVTGTEGMSAVRRNPTRRGQATTMMAAAQPNKRNEALPEPVSKVTGGSGNTESGSLVTYSGGARG